MKIRPISWKGSIALLFCALVLGSSTPGLGDEYPELEASFRQFLAGYIMEIKSGNREYLEIIHPNLPVEQRGFFIGITVDMMKYAQEESLTPQITCREYGMCKATWPQPGDSWAAQTFVRHERQWRWLVY